MFLTRLVVRSRLCSLPKEHVGNGGRRDPSSSPAGARRPLPALGEAPGTRAGRSLKPSTSRTQRPTSTQDGPTPDSPTTWERFATRIPPEACRPCSSGQAGSRSEGPSRPRRSTARHSKAHEGDASIVPFQDEGAAPSGTHAIRIFVREKAPAPLCSAEHTHHPLSTWPAAMEGALRRSGAATAYRISDRTEAVAREKSCLFRARFRP